MHPIISPHKLGEEEIIRRHTLTLWTVVLALTGASFISGCGDSATEPNELGLTLQGTLVLEGGGDASQAAVNLFSAPQDASISQMLAEYPSIGFSPIQLMLFDPLSQTPIRTSSPDVNGHFSFEDLPRGTYIVDAVLAGYACPQPEEVTLSSDSNIGDLWLSAEQEVSGNLGNTTWQSGVVYTITGDIMVLPDAALTVQQGTLILLEGDYSLTITGSLQIDGSPTHPVRFRLARDHYQTGGNWDGIRLENPAQACAITAVSIQGASTALRINGGEGQISECLFDAPTAYGVFFAAGAEGGVEHCIVRDGDNGLTASYSHPEFAHNLILNMAGTGIEVKDSSQAEISDNVILDCQTGIWSDWRTAPLIQYNLISGGDRALEAQRGFSATIQYNEFREQALEGILFHNGYCYSLLENNNFINMPQIILTANCGSGAEPDTIYAPYNYWDGEDGEGIPSRIIDGHDLGTPANPVSPVEYEPFRLDPLSGAGP